jgi:hypothetical protein
LTTRRYSIWVSSGLERVRLETCQFYVRGPSDSGTTRNHALVCRSS